MGFISSLVKNIKLPRIMRELSQSVPASEAIGNAVKGRKSSSEKAKVKLFSLIQNDPDLCKVLIRHNSNIEEVKFIYDQL